MVWLACFLELLKFLEFLSSPLGRSTLLWTSLYFCLQAMGVDVFWAAMLPVFPAFHLYWSLERSGN